MLNAILDREVIWEALKSLHPTKTLGPDGMPALFFQFFWKIVSNDIITTIQNIFRHGIFLQRLNDSFIVFISKTTQFSTFNQIRPIALCNTLYKVFSKILVHWLWPLLQNIISPNQTSFVPG